MRLRVLTYNIHKCIGGVDRRFDPARIWKVIDHYRPDLALLQEVDDRAERSRFHRQVDLLGDLLGYRHRTWFANVAVRGGGEYGNAVLSRFPLTETRNIDLTVPLKKRRGALHARYRVRVGAGRVRTLHVFNMHLGLSGFERKVQLRRFLAAEMFARLHPRAPIILGGDLNDVWGTLGYKVLEPAGFSRTPTPPTFPAWAPVRALDGLYVRGGIHMLSVARARVEVARFASDHLPLIAEVELV